MTTALRWTEGKNPADSWPYALDATDAMTKAGDTLASATVAGSPAGLTFGSPVTTPAGVVTVLISGGVAGVDYTVAITMTSAAGRTLKRSVKLLVSEI